MKHCGIQQNIFVSCEEMTRSAAVSGRSSEKRETVVCPKPRRLGLIHPTLCDPYPLKPIRWQASHPQETWEAKACNELTEIILTEAGSPENVTPQSSSSLPFFSGSPPSRASNPLIQDKIFLNKKFTPVEIESSPPAPSTPKGGSLRANFSNNPAVRVEGFDCLDRDRRNCGIPALAQPLREILHNLDQVRRVI